MTRCDRCGFEPEPSLKPGFPFLLLVEGNDDRNFFKALSGKMRLDNKLQVFNLGGRNKLNGTIKAIFPDLLKFEIQRLGVCIDAESPSSKTFKEAFQQARTALSNAGLPSPTHPMKLSKNGALQVAVMIMPDNRSSGMLETICNRSIAGKPEIACVEKYFQCLDGISCPTHRLREDKSRLASFLAIQERPGFSVGVSAEQGIFDFDDEAFDIVREFLGLIVS